jgi:hypothetical protein
LFFSYITVTFFSLGSLVLPAFCPIILHRFRVSTKCHSSSECTLRHHINEGRLIFLFGHVCSDSHKFGSLLFVLFLYYFLAFCHHENLFLPPPQAFP